MSYTTLQAVKAWAGFHTDDDDDVLEALITTCEDVIDRYCDTTFEVSEETTHDYHRYRDYNDNRFDGRKLYFHEWAAEAPSAITDSPTVLNLPEDGPPYYGLYLVDGTWAYPTVTVTTYWGYSKEVPPSVEQACLRLVKWLYDMKDSYGVDAIITPDGHVILPEGLPFDVTLLLSPFRKRVVA